MKKEQEAFLENIVESFLPEEKRRVIETTVMERKWKEDLIFVAGQKTKKLKQDLT